MREYPKRIRATAKDVDGKEYTAGMDVLNAHEEACVKDGTASLQVLHHAVAGSATGGVQIRLLSVPPKKAPKKGFLKKFQPSKES